MFNALDPKIKSKTFLQPHESVVERYPDATERNLVFPEDNFSILT